MERVQFQQEQMLAELKDLEEKGLFTKKEIKHILKKRTAFETALVRRVAKKNDFLRYISYEMDLEALRKKRLERIKIEKRGTSISDYAIVRRQFHIFERALKKFKADVGLWIQYIQLAKKEGARSLVGRISARALQLHPNVPSLYILAASHEIQHLSPSAARTLLQRGIRMNAESTELWREYVKMELGFVESMRRRWEVLGINVSTKGKERAQIDEDMGDGDAEKMQVEAEGESDESEEARKAIMEGAIVISAITNAAKSLPKAELFVSLNDLLSTYPIPTQLRSSLLDHLHTLLQQTLPTDPVAVRLAATRSLISELKGAEFVDALKNANDKISSALIQACLQKSVNSDGLARTYASFITDWVAKNDLDDSLKAYLLTTLHATVQRTTKNSVTPAVLLSTELRLLRINGTLLSLLPHIKNIAGLAKRYTSLPKGQADANVWKERLEAEKLFAGNEVGKSLQEARRAVQGEGILDVWLWGIPAEDDVEDEKAAKECLISIEERLSDSMRMQDAPSFREVHESLFSRAAHTLAHLSSPQARLTQFSRLKTSYLPTLTTFCAFFNAEASLPDGQVSEVVLKEMYEAWQRKDGMEAALAWAEWLIERARGKEAGEVVKRARAMVEGQQRMELEERWLKVLNGVSKEETEDQDTDM